MEKIDIELDVLLETAEIPVIDVVQFFEVKGDLPFELQEKVDDFLLRIRNRAE